MNNHQRRAATYGKAGAAITTLEREWRISRGESPNPWRPMDSFDEHAGTRVLQIVNKRGMSKLEMRSLLTPDDPNAHLGAVEKS